MKLDRQKTGTTAALLLVVSDIQTRNEYLAQDNPPPLDPARIDFVLGNVEFALLHELAHLVIGEMDLPILRPEEQAADYLATMSLLRPIEEPPIGRERWLEFALTTADAFVILWQLGRTHRRIVPVLGQPYALHSAFLYDRLSLVRQQSRTFCRNSCPDRHAGAASRTLCG